MSSLLLELVLRNREPSRPLTSFSLALDGAYAVEIDERGRRLGSHRLALANRVAEAARLFDGEEALVREVVALVARAGCLVTAQGRQLELPALEALAIRHAVALPGHFELEDPYRARRSRYNVDGHLDLSAFLADGDRRLRALGLDLLAPFISFGGAPLPRRSLETDTLAAARERALGAYLLYLRVQRLRGLLESADVRARLDELGRSGVSLSGIPAWAADPLAPPQTRLPRGRPGLLALDIETVLDTEAVARCLGRKVDDPITALAELLGSPTEFAPPLFHRVVAIALCHWDPPSGEVELERLRLGGTSGAGAALPTEADLLSAFWSAAEGKRLVSYNGKRFDLPVLLYRSLPHPIEAPWYLAAQRPPFEQYRHPQSRRQIDLFDQLGGGLSPGPLATALHAVGLPGKLGPNGGEVQALWDRGQCEAIGDYCLQDAAQTLLLGLRFLQVSGEFDAEAIRAGVAAAKGRFACEPALAGVLSRADGYFDDALKR